MTSAAMAVGSAERAGGASEPLQALLLGGHFGDWARPGHEPSVPVLRSWRSSVRWRR